MTSEDGLTGRLPSQDGPNHDIVGLLSEERDQTMTLRQLDRAGRRDPGERLGSVGGEVEEEPADSVATCECVITGCWMHKAGARLRPCRITASK